MPNPFRYFKTSPEIIRLLVMMYVRFTQLRWHLDEVFVRINGETCYLWRVVDQEGEVLEAFVT
jgi:putative transposase